MFAKSKKVTVSLLSALTLMAGIGAPSVEAQQNQQGGLVNVAVFEVIDDVTVVVEDVNVAVGAAANIAANVCGVAVPVSVLSVVFGGVYECENEVGDAGVIITQL